MRQSCRAERLEARLLLADANPPVVLPFAKTVPFCDGVAFATDDFAAQFVPDAQGGPLSALEVVSLPSHGGLWLSGAPVASGQMLDSSQLNSLKYVAATDFIGNDAFSWTATDGQLWAASPAQVQFSVGAVNGRLAVPAGAHSISLDIAQFTPNVTLDVQTGASLTLAAPQHLSFLHLESASRVTLAAGVGVLRSAGMAIDGGAVLDTTDNDLILDYTGTAPLASIRPLLANGQMGLTPAILSSAVPPSPDFEPVVGMLDNAKSRLPNWGSEALDPAEQFRQLLFRSTRAGDVNLDGTVSESDYTNIIANMGRSDATWFEGDVNLDGVVTPDDLAIVSAHLATTSAPRMLIRDTSGRNDDLAVDFGTVQTGLQSDSIDVTISNIGNGVLHVTRMQLAGTGAEEFSFEVVGLAAGTTAFEVKSGRTQVIRLRFSPATVADRTVTLNFQHDDPAAANPQSIQIHARGGAREWFQTFGTYSTGASLGAFSHIDGASYAGKTSMTESGSGTIFKRRSGPQESNAATGWSGDLGASNLRAWFDTQADPRYASVATAGQVGFWLWIGDYPGYWYGQSQPIFSVANNAALGSAFGYQEGATLSIGAGDELHPGNVWCSLYQGGPAAPVAVPLRTWVWFGVAWTRLSGTNWNVSILEKSPADSQPVTVCSIDNTQWYATSVPCFGINKVAYATEWQCNARIGGITIDPLTSISEAGIPADTRPPDSTATTIYVGNGAADGDGTQASPFTIQQLADEMSRCGVMGSNGGTGTGDTVLFDDGGTSIELTTSLDPSLRQRGITFDSARSTPAVLSAWKTMTGPFPQYDSTAYPAVYTYTDGEMAVNGQCVMTANGVLYNVVQAADPTSPATIMNPSNSQWTNYANPLAALQANPGTMWRYNNVVYFNSGTNPNADGASYRRSRVGGVGMTADGTVQNLVITGTMGVDTTNLQNAIGSALHDSAPAYGNAIWRNVTGTYWGKHGQAVTQNRVNSTLLIDDVTMELGYPWGWGSQTAFVSYMDANPANTGNVDHYRNCKTVWNSALIGGAPNQGTIATDPVFLTHNTGSSGSPRQFAKLWLEDCDFSAGAIAQSDDNTDLFLIQGTTCTSAGDLKSLTVVDRSKATAGMFYSSGGTTVTNSIMQINGDLGSGGSYLAVSGTQSYTNCVFDLSALTGSGTCAFLNRTGILNLTVRNCLFILPAGFDVAVIRNLSASDTVLFEGNAYVLGPNKIFAANYNGGGQYTFADWQALGPGHDVTNSFATTSPQVDAGYRPLGQSVLIDAGINLGSADDYTGKVWDARDDIGAFEIGV
ncbi:MAG: dockerin type I domain-containing protein [Tepidisphaerales bacterium]